MNNQEEIKIIDLTPENINDYGVCGYKDVQKHVELRKKIEWFKLYFPKGLQIKILISKIGGYQGMIEYIPGEYAHRPVDARGYMFIHCVFVGFKKEFKGKGFASKLISSCIQDAKRKNMKGVAIVTRKGSFMVNKDIFLKLEFKEVDSAKPDFSLMLLSFNNQYDPPRFKDMTKHLNSYKKGLTILRSPQCPYTEKNVKAILESAKKKFQLKPILIDIESAEKAQQSPCPFGSFCIIYNGEIISHHPISNTRFENIMRNKIM